MRSKRLILNGTVSAMALLLAGGAANAQDGGLEEIVITGLRGSIVQSIQTKRESTAIVDAITAEDIGKFPDKNVAESLSHVPGITVDRDYGEGERVSIRGTDPALNRTLLNGQTVASTDWFILDSPGRTFNYTLLAPEVVGRLEVYKSPEARIDEGSIGGTVILHTRRPLDLDPLTASASIEYGYSDRANKGSPNASGLLSWHNENDSFGFLVSATRQEQDIRRDGFESLGYPTVSNTAIPAALVGGTAAAANIRIPNVINSALFEQKRERTGGTAALQFRPNDQLEVNATGFYVKGKYDNYNQSRYYFNAWGGVAPGAVSNVTVRDGVVTGATFAPGGGLMLLDAISRKSELETYTGDLKADWTDDDWSASAQIGRTKSTGGTQQQLFGEFEQLTGYSFDISGAPGRIATVTPQFDPKSPTGIGLGFAQLRQQPTEDKETYGQVDFSKDVDLNVFEQIKFGAKYRDHETSRDARLRRVVGGNRPLADFDGGQTPGDFLGGISVNDALKDWFTADRERLEEFLTNPPTGFVDASYFDFLPEQFAVREKISAAYTQANLKGEGFRGNFGVRFVHTDQTSSGSRDIAGSPFGAPITPAGNIRPVSFEKTYNDWLPSANFAFDLTDDLVVRFAGSRVIARANYADLSTTLTTTNTVRSGDGGNPDLDPYRANNFDVSAEWYMNRTSLVAATAFYKDVGSYIFRVTGPEPLFNTDTNVTETFTITRPRNGGSATVKGIELIYQGDVWDNVGIQVNYTYADSTTPRGTTPLPFSSKHSFNITPYYENELFSARVTYGYRSKYFREVNRGTEVYNDSYEQLDASLTVNVTEQIALTAQAQNLLDETQYQYAGERDVPYAAFKNGRRYFVGARFTY
ncbi:MAG TPA: TonB-dependent receptor [Azospirillaceae bacterium]|nr:TonB-dependent receptor [Azospirillaceae bacterium]